MSDLHDLIGAFIDGELPPADAERFREHLASCSACQQDLADFVQLDAVAGATALRVEAPRPAPVRARRVQLIGVGALLAAALAVFIATRPHAPASAPVSLAEARSVEGRVTWPVADSWRPWEPTRSAAAAQSEPISASTLAALESGGDQRSLGAAWLLAGNATRARQALEALPQTADVASDLSAVQLSEGRAEEALALAQAALELTPKHPQATWNRAVALERLGAALLAAQTFHELEARAEPGWSQEAAARARALDLASTEARAKTQSALDGAARMVLGGPGLSAEQLRAMPSWARMNLRYALLTATSRDRVLSLAPVGRALDELFGGSWVSQAVTRAANAEFSPRRLADAQHFRALVVDYYRALAAAGPGPTVDASEPGLGAETAPWVASLKQRKALEFLVFALPMGRALGEPLTDYAEAVAHDGDPWFALALELERARRELAAGDSPGAERRLLELVSRAAQAPLRALQAHELLAVTLTAQHRVVEGTSHAMDALRLARSQGEQGAATRLLSTLADAARFRNATALATAFLEERVLRQPADCTAKGYAYESMAAMAIVSLDVSAARARLSQVPSCTSLSVVGAGVLADLTRLAPQPSDSTQLTDVLAALRQATSDEQEQALLDHLEGRFQLDVDRARGTSLLRSAMARAKASVVHDAVPRKVLAHGYGLLRIAAGEAKEWSQLFALTAEERSVAAPDHCALVIEVQDNRVAVAGRDAHGADSGASRRFDLHVRRPSPGLTLEELAQLTEPIARAVAPGCARLSVFASYPLHGRTGWIPDDIAWAYSGGGTQHGPSGTQGLVVRDVATPTSLGLPRLATWDDSVRPNDAELKGDAATPQRVLEAMQTASFVELHVHARVNPADADTAALVLAADDAGQFTLSAKTLGETRLKNDPVVLLAACRASTVAPFLHEPWSLPRAFLHAGASAVIAAPVDLPDAEARSFFRAVTDRVRAGQDAATAVRDERLHFLQQRHAPWVRTVLVFD